MELILPSYRLSKETVTTIRKHYKNTKAMVHSSSEDRLFFDIVTIILQRDTLALYICVCSGYTMYLETHKAKKRKWFKTEKRQETDDILQKL